MRTTFQKEDKCLEIDLSLFKIICLEAPWCPPTIQRNILTITLKNVSICTLGLNHITKMSSKCLSIPWFRSYLDQLRRERECKEISHPESSLGKNC